LPSPAREALSEFPPVQRLPAQKGTDMIDVMKFNKSIGMVLLAIYLILHGLLGFGLPIGPAIFLVEILALAAGVFILIGK
jgi:hypothetical protein